MFQISEIAASQGCLFLFSLLRLVTEAPSPAYSSLMCLVWPGLWSHLPSCFYNHIAHGHSLQLQTLTVFFRHFLLNNIAVVWDLKCWENSCFKNCHDLTEDQNCNHHFFWWWHILHFLWCTLGPEDDTGSQLLPGLVFSSAWHFVCSCVKDCMYYCVSRWHDTCEQQAMSTLRTNQTLSHTAEIQITGSG